MCASMRNPSSGGVGSRGGGGQVGSVASDGRRFMEAGGEVGTVASGKGGGSSTKVCDGTTSWERVGAKGRRGKVSRGPESGARSPPFAYTRGNMSTMANPTGCGGAIRGFQRCVDGRTLSVRKRGGVRTRQARWKGAQCSTAAARHRATQPARDSQGAARDDAPLYVQFTFTL